MLGSGIGFGVSRSAFLTEAQSKNWRLPLKFYEYDITYAASVRSDFAFYEASELLGTKEMTVREFIERIADVCKCIESGGGEVERGEVDGEINKMGR